MNLITKTVILPKAGKVRITFYRDRRKATKDKTTFSLPFDIHLNGKIAIGEIIYSPLLRSCRIMWNEPPDDKNIVEETENFIKEFLFGTLMAITEPIDSNEADKIINNFKDFFWSSIQYTITGTGACVLMIPIGSRASRQVKIIIRKKDTGDYFFTDDGLILRSFRPHERGQREKVVFGAKKIGIEVKEEELILNSSAEDLTQNLYKFIQFVSAVYLFYLI